MAATDENFITLPTPLLVFWGRKKFGEGECRDHIMPQDGKDGRHRRKFHYVADSTFGLLGTKEIW